MTVNEIKAAVEAGKKVHWVNRSYTVIKDSIGQFLIMNCDQYRGFPHYIGLTHADGVTLNGRPDQFYIAD